MAGDAQKPQRLGRGLAVMFKDVGVDMAPTPSETPKGNARKLPIAFLRRNPRNPRKAFGDGELAELAESIKAKGVIQPIIVRPVADEKDSYEIIAGERRWRAAQKAMQDEVPVVILEVTDREALEIALVENVQRTDLNPLEEASAYDQLIEEFQYSHAELGGVIGKSRSHVANMLRLLSLPPKVKKYVEEGRLSAGHARALLTMPDADRVAEKIVEQGLTVREVESLGQVSRAVGKELAGKPEKSADLKAFEKSLSDLLMGLMVTLKPKGQKGGGEIRIAYKTLDQLDDICRRLKS